MNVDFTREPIIETIITPKEGCKLVVRSSKSTGQEEYFVDAVEVVAFGHALFFRSLERPKAFLVPISDYEVLEVREARMVLKNAGLDRSIKIGGGREGSLKANREVEKTGGVAIEEEAQAEVGLEEGVVVQSSEAPAEVRVDKKRDRRRHYRKRKGKEEGVKEGEAELAGSASEEGKAVISTSESSTEEIQEEVSAPITSSLFSSLLQPPPTLISETISRYRQNDLFKSAFYLTEEEQYKPHDKVQDLLNEDDDEFAPLQEPTFAEEPSELSSPYASSEESFREQPHKEEERREGQLEDQPESLSDSEEKEKGMVVEIEEAEAEAALPLYAEEDLTDIKREGQVPQEPVEAESKNSADHQHSFHEENPS
jgi:hypothetical protein